MAKPRPKLAESCSRQARLAPSQLVGVGGAAVDGEERLAATQARCRRIDHTSQRAQQPETEDVAGRAGRADVTDVVPPYTVALQSRVGVPVGTRERSRLGRSVGVTPSVGAPA